MVMGNGRKRDCFADMPETGTDIHRKLFSEQLVLKM
jgi:hypothetical protein